MAYSAPVLINGDNPLVTTAWEGGGHRKQENKKSWIEWNIQGLYLTISNKKKKKWPFNSNKFHRMVNFVCWGRWQGRSLVRRRGQPLSFLLPPLFFFNYFSGEKKKILLVAMKLQWFTVDKDQTNNSYGSFNAYTNYSWNYSLEKVHLIF